MRISFDLKNQEEYREFRPLPENWYVLALSEVTDVSKNSKRTMRFEFSVVEGDFKGRKLFGYWTWDSDNMDDDKGSVEAGRSRIKSLAVACKTPNAADTMEMVGIPFNAYVVVDKPDPKTGKSYNSIKKFEPKTSQFAQSEPASVSPDKQNEDAPWWQEK